MAPPDIEVDTKESTSIEYYDNNKKSRSVIKTEDSIGIIYISAYKVNPQSHTVDDSVLAILFGKGKAGNDNIPLPYVKNLSSLGAISVLFSLN